MSNFQLQLTSPSLEQCWLDKSSSSTPSSGLEMAIVMCGIGDQVTLVKRLISQVVTDWNSKVRFDGCGFGVKWLEGKELNSWPPFSRCRIWLIYARKRRKNETETIQGICWSRLQDLNFLSWVLWQVRTWVFFLSLEWEWEFLLTLLLLFINFAITSTFGEIHRSWRDFMRGPLGALCQGWTHALTRCPGMQATFIMTGLKHWTLPDGGLRA